MLDMYPVYLKLGWKHSVSCVSRTSQTRNTHHRRESTCCPYTISRRIADSLKLPAARSSASRSVAEPSESSSLFVALHICAPPCILHAQLHMHRLMAVHKLVRGLRRLPTTSLRRREIILVLLPQVYFVPVYLAVYLVCICFQDRNTQIHAYPHPSPSVSNI